MPVSAELKMLKFLQERVNKATKAFDEQPKEAKHTAAGGQKADQIAGKQGRVQQLMRKLAVKLNKENHAEEER
ncbi:MAG: hypothetical protein NXI31_05210 [bacterium]|nr:hypothetical protein [bacterium]